jgi:glutaredoxin
MLKRWLDEKSVKYTDHLVDQDASAARKMIQLSGQMGVPFSTIEYDGKMEKILGFDRQKFEAVIKLAQSN